MDRKGQQQVGQALNSNPFAFVLILDELPAGTATMQPHPALAHWKNAASGLWGSGRRKAKPSNQPTDESWCPFSFPVKPIPNITRMLTPPHICSPQSINIPQEAAANTPPARHTPEPPPLSPAVHFHLVPFCGVPESTSNRLHLACTKNPERQISLSKR